MGAIPFSIMQILNGESKKRGWLRDSTMSGLRNSLPWPTEMLHPIFKIINIAEYHTIWLLKSQYSLGLTYSCVKASPFFLTHPLINNIIIIILLSEQSPLLKENLVCNSCKNSGCQRLWQILIINWKDFKKIGINN